MPPRSPVDDPSAVQDRLLQMLDTMHVEQAADQSAEHSPSACPHCRSTDPWGTSPWCPKCGFYPKLNRVLEGVAEAPPGNERNESSPADGHAAEDQNTDSEAAEERDEEIEKIESGLTVLFLAVLLFIPAAVLFGLYFLGVDLKGILVNAGLLPKSAAVASAEKEKTDAPGEAPTASPGSGGPTSASAAAQATAPSSPAGGQSQSASGNRRFLEPVGEHRRDTSEFVIFGFTTNAAGELRSVLIAEFTDDGRGRFAGRLSTDETRSSIVAELSSEFKKILTRRAALSCPYRANWVKPILRCRVAHDGRTFDQRINDGEIVGFYETPTQ